jgi:O-Antigen ligase
VRLALLTFAVSIAYLPLPSYSTAGRWAVCAFVCVLLWQARPKMGPAHWMGLAFLVWCFLSFFWSVGKLDTINQLYHILLLAGVFVVASVETDLWPTTLALGCGITVSAVIAFLQLNGYHPVSAVTEGEFGVGGAGLFLNKDFFAQVASPALLLAIGFGTWAFVPAALFGVIATASREAWIATALGGLVLICWKLPSFKWRVAVTVAIVALCFAALRYDLNLLNGARLSSFNDRIAFWQYTLPNITWLGYGLGTYPLLWPGWDHAHNEFLELAFEIGLGVVPLVGVFVYALSASLSAPAQAALVSLLVSACTYFPFHQPTTAFLAALLAGHLCGARDRLRCAKPQGRVYRWTSTKHSEPLGAGALCRADLSRADLPFRPELAERS